MAASTAKISTETPYISTEFASHLAASFIENALFLKNQVPFPIAQLSRVQGSKLDKRAEKHRVELLESFDLLCSHLGTTFSALSTALARRTPPPNAFPAYLVVIIGPTASAMSAKAKLVLAMDSLEARVWGERDDRILDASQSEGDTDPVDSDTDDEASVDDEDDTDEEDATDSEGSSSSGSLHNVEEHTAIPPRLNRPHVFASPPPPAHKPTVAAAYATPSPETRTMRSVARSLATVLNDGEGIGSDLAPTLTHILLLAPRRFTHPAWVPRQQLGSRLGLGRGVLDDFWTAIKEDLLESLAPSGRKPQRVRTEGLLLQGTMRTEDNVLDAEDEDEEDEMIWWNWDGKLAGFAG